MRGFLSAFFFNFVYAFRLAAKLSDHCPNTQASGFGRQFFIYCFFACSEFDAEGYKSEEDPDFVPEENALEVDQSSDDEDQASTHSQDAAESSGTEGMEE